MMKKYLSLVLRTVFLFLFLVYIYIVQPFGPLIALGALILVGLNGYFMIKDQKKQSRIVTAIFVLGLTAYAYLFSDKMNVISSAEGESMNYTNYINYTRSMADAELACADGTLLVFRKNDRDMDNKPTGIIYYIEPNNAALAPKRIFYSHSARQPITPEELETFAQKPCANETFQNFDALKTYALTLQPE